MNVDDFRRMYVIELQELRSVEDQLVQALPKMVELVEHPGLRRALELHHTETKSQRDRLDKLLKRRSSPGVYLVYCGIEAGAPGTRKDACRGVRAAAAIAAQPVVRCGALAGARAISR
jgi:ferritin-like metal-binding protein YciE